MSLKIDSTATPKPIIKELENGSKVKFRFIWKDDHFEIKTKLYSGTDQPTPCKWPATLKGVSNQVTAEELQGTEEFLNKAKLAVCWELNKPVIQIRENEINYNQESTISLQSNNSMVIEQKRIKKNAEPLLNPTVIRSRSNVLKLNDLRISSSFNKNLPVIKSENVLPQLPVEIKAFPFLNPVQGFQGLSKLFNKNEDTKKLYFQLEASNYSDQGNLYASQGRFNEAIDAYKKCIEIYCELGDRLGEASAYDRLGNTYYRFGDFKGAIEFYKKQLELALELKDLSGQRKAYGNLGNAYDDLGDFKGAIESYKKYLVIALEFRDRSGEARVYSNLGLAYNSLGDFKQAIEFHKKHLAIALELKDLSGQGRAYANLGLAYNSLGDFKEAIEFHKKHLAIALVLGDRSDEGIAYGNLGLAYNSLRDFKGAIESYKKYLAMAIEFRDRSGEGSVYSILGNAYNSLGDFKEAIEFHKKHLAIALELKDRSGEGRAYSSLGVVYNSLSDFKGAIEFHKKHLAIALELKDRSGEGSAYSSLGNTYYRFGDFKGAIEFYKKDLVIALELGDRSGEGRAYGNLGHAYNSLGDFKGAIEFNKKHLAIALELKNRSSEGIACNNLGNAYHGLGDFERAVEFVKKHLGIALELGDRSGEGSAYCNLGVAYRSLGDFEGAIEFYKKSLAIALELGDRLGEGEVCNNLGFAYYSFGDFKGAIELYKKSLAIALELGDRSIEGKVYHNLTATYNQLKDYPSAEEHGRKAVEVYSQIQRSLGKDSWKITIFEQQASVYSLLIAFLINQGKFEEALSIGDFSKSRALSDFLNIRAQLPLNEKPLSPVEMQKIASSQNATLVFFNDELFSKEASIFAWVVPPKGEISFLPLKPKASYKDKLGSAFSTLAPFQTREEKSSISSEWEFQNISEAEEIREETLREAPSANAYKVKSSQKALSNAKTPEEKYQAFISLGEAHRVGGEWGPLLEVGKQLETLSKEQNNPQWECQAYLILAEAFNGSGQHLEAQKFAKEAEGLASELSLKKEKGLALQQLALAEQNPNQAFQLCKESLRILETLGELRVEAKSWRIYGSLLLKNTQFSETTPKEAFERALLLLDNTFDPYERLLINLGLAQLEKEPSKALSHYNEAIRLAKALKATQLLKELLPKRQQIVQKLKEDCDTYLKDWHETLIAPLEKHLKKGEKVIFIPDTSLQSLPFAILQDPKGRFLIEDYIISIAPSAEVLNLLSSINREEPTQEAFIIGDPTFDLPKSEKDAKIVGEFFGITPLIGEQATLSEVTQQAPEARFVHLSCHGIAGMKPEGKPESVFEGALKLTPHEDKSTYLHALDIQKLPLKAEMVFLAACKSGKGKQQREGSIGLTRSFLAAGVPSVVATHWSIPDSDVTVDFIENFYAYILGKHPKNDYKKLGKAEALQQTMIGLLKEHPELRNQPHKWGAFFLLGLN